MTLLWFLHLQHILWILIVLLLIQKMIRNSLQTSLKESVDLFSFRLIFYIVFLAILPAYIVYKTK